MPKLSQHQAGKFVKLLYIGDSSTGKTGSLTSLVKDGYDLRILDLDNGLDPLRQFVGHECPDRLDSIDFETVRDTYKATAQGPVVMAPKAYVAAVKLLTKWSDESSPAEWGEKTIFVLDSLTTLGKAAFEWARGMNPSAKDPRQWYFAAQQSLENIIAMLTSEEFRTNVIVISHVNYRELATGEIKGYASAVGSALGPTLPKYFNNLVLAETSGSGKNARRRIKTLPTGMIDLKNAAPFKVEHELPLESGMATLFGHLKSI